MSNDEARISRLLQVLSELSETAGAKENTKIIPNVEVVDASPSNLPTEYIIVSDDLGYYIPALKVPGLSYVSGNFVNLLMLKGTEPIAFQHGSASSGSNGGGGNFPAYEEIKVFKTDSSVETYSSLSDAATSAQTGETILLGPGEFDGTGLTFASGVSLIGVGGALASGGTSITFTNAGMTFTNFGYVAYLNVNLQLNSADTFSIISGASLTAHRVSMDLVQQGAAELTGFDLSGDSYLYGCVVNSSVGTALLNSGNVAVYGGRLNGEEYNVDNSGVAYLIAVELGAIGTFNGSVQGIYQIGGDVHVTDKLLLGDTTQSPLNSLARSAAPSLLVTNGDLYLDDGTNRADGLPGWRARIAGAWVDLGVGGGRELLTAARTYYVNGSTGNDSNDGLTSGTPFLTIQKAVNVASALDNGGFAITINVANGTYDETVTLKSFVGDGLITLSGDTATPSNVNVRGAGGSGSNIFVANNVLGIYRLQGFLFSGGINAIQVQNSSIQFQLCEFGTVTGNHLFSVDGGLIQAVGNYFIIGGAARHYYASSSSTIRVVNRTVTIVSSGASNFSDAFARADTIAGLATTGITFTIVLGSVTGTRYRVITNAVINTAGGGANYFPGNVAGVTGTGGQYV